MFSCWWWRRVDDEYRGEEDGVCMYIGGTPHGLEVWILFLIGKLLSLLIDSL